MESITSEILKWYHLHQRNLPWRETSNPYRVWLSEIILQQTRVSQGLPYYQRFVEAFPDLASLAAASEIEVLREWQGLGYYSRARNMLNCAREVQERYNGRFPQSYEELLELPGIGAYTAAAVASIAFKERVAVVDGNVIRVLSRLFGIQQVATSGAGKKIFQKMAQQLLPMDRPDQFNQAIMEFGALQCTPRPNCIPCPIAQHCYAREFNQQQDFPVKPKKTPVTDRFFHYLVLMFEGKLLMRRRDQKDIWRGLYDFYLVESAQALDIEELCRQSTAGQILATPESSIDNPVEYLHKLSHQRILVTFYPVRITSEPVFGYLAEEYGLEKFTLQEIHHLPKPILVANFLKEQIF